MSDENGTIKQRIELEDKVTPALDSMLKSIQGTTTAMGALLKSIERFQNIATNFGFNINFERTAEAVKRISEAYENAAKHAQGLANTANHIQPKLPVSSTNPKPSLSSVGTKSNSSGMGMGGLISGGIGKLSMIAGGITAAFVGVKKLADTASERTTQINSLNYMSEAQRNGLKGDEIQDYGVKYANRIGMSADDFTTQSIKLLKTTDAFGSIGESMNFNELLQKQLKASGVDAQGASRVTEMYSRGLMKGFDSAELKTIMKEAPALADALAKAAKVSNPAELLSKASKGKITSQIAKDAIFGNADDIEKQFAQTPKTMNELFEKLKNSAEQILDPISQKITDIANKPEVQAFVDRLIDGMTWFSEVAGEAFEFVTDTITTIAPHVEEIVTPIKDILFSVWDIIKGLIDDIVELFTKDEEFGKTAQTIWSDFKIVLERLKPVVEGIVETIAGGIKILLGVAKNTMTYYENLRIGLHNIFSDDNNALEYKSFDTDVFVEGAIQIAGGVKKGIVESVDLIGDTLTKNLEPIANIPIYGPSTDLKNKADDRIHAGIGMTPSKPLHVKQVGKTKIDKESLQLLKDLAQAEIINRVNNIQPAITANFGDVHETADIDAMLDRLEKDVVSARGQNLMLQTGMQYAL